MKNKSDHLHMDKILDFDLLIFCITMELNLLMNFILSEILKKSRYGRL